MNKIKYSSKPSSILEPSFSHCEKQTNGLTSGLAKWTPLICAGAAVCVSIIALKEIKNVRRELKKVESPQKQTELYEKMLTRIEAMDKQIIKMDQYLLSKSKEKGGKEKGGKERSKEELVKNVVPVVENINIINKPLKDDEVEYVYEEVEVTDDEEEK